MVKNSALVSKETILRCQFYKGKGVEMRQAEIPIFFLQILVVVVVPFLPTNGLLLLDWLPVRILMAVLLLYFTSVGPVVAVFGFVSIALLYMERNRRKVQGGLKKWEELEAISGNLSGAPVEEAHRAQSTVRVAPMEMPRGEETEYAPLEEGGGATGPEEPLDVSIFEPVAPTQNEKVVLASAYPVSHQAVSSTASMESIYEQLGVGHIRGM